MLCEYTHAGYKDARRYEKQREIGWLRTQKDMNLLFPHQLYVLGVPKKWLSSLAYLIPLQVLCLYPILIFH